MYTRAKLMRKGASCRHPKSLLGTRGETGKTCLIESIGRNSETGGDITMVPGDDV